MSSCSPPASITAYFGCGSSLAVRMRLLIRTYRLTSPAVGKMTTRPFVITYEGRWLMAHDGLSSPALHVTPAATVGDLTDWGSQPDMEEGQSDSSGILLWAGSAAPPSASWCTRKSTMSFWICSSRRPSSGNWAIPWMIIPGWGRYAMSPLPEKQKNTSRTLWPREPTSYLILLDSSFKARTSFKRPG